MGLKMRWLASEMDQINKNKASRRPSKQEKKHGICIMKSSGRYEKIHQAYKKTQKNSKNMSILSKAWLSPRGTSRTLSMCWRRRSPSRWQTWTPVYSHLGAYLCCLLFNFAQMGLRPPCISFLELIETICYRYHQAVEKKWILETSLTLNLGLNLCQSMR